MKIVFHKVFHIPSSIVIPFLKSAVVRKRGVNFSHPACCFAEATFRIHFELIPGKNASHKHNDKRIISGTTYNLIAFADGVELVAS